MDVLSAQFSRRLLDYLFTQHNRMQSGEGGAAPLMRGVSEPGSHREQ
jgi:hypothetical protein